MTFSGGEPFCQPEGFLELAKGVKERGLNITSFSGYTYEQLADMAAESDMVKKLLDMTDILVDGPFIKAQRDLTLQFRGSSNQRVIDMNRTRAEGHIVIWHQK